MHPLDVPVLSSLSGAHAHLAERHGRILRYQPDVAPFLALPEPVDESIWPELATLFGPGTVLPATIGATPPATWGLELDLPGVQLVGEQVPGKGDDEAVILGPADVPEMLDLVSRTKPGPFLPRTIEMGTYLGIRRGGALVAVAGERLHPAGYTEISAVCTDAAFRGQGLASRLVLAVAAGIRARDETPFLHVAATNSNAIRLYESLGFTRRRQLRFVAARVPG